jgi:glycerophosphoryl diester phosphodiesterase
MDLPENQNRPLNIAHRGARSLAPENTLAAARKGLEVGADMWELDIQMSSWFREQDPFGQIAAGMVAPADLTSYAGVPAPTLDQALSFTREHNWRVNVEIKDLSRKPGDTQIVKRVMALVTELEMEDRVLISSFNHDYLAQIREAHPHIATGILVSRPHPQPVALLQRFRAQAYHPRLSFLLPRKEIALLRSKGFGVNVRTVNDKKTMQRRHFHRFSPGAHLGLGLLHGGTRD